MNPRDAITKHTTKNLLNKAFPKGKKPKYRGKLPEEIRMDSYATEEEKGKGLSPEDKIAYRSLIRAGDDMQMYARARQSRALRSRYKHGTPSRERLREMFKKKGKPIPLWLKA